MRIALAGNPNCGKTTMFNDLTGITQKLRAVLRKDGAAARAYKQLDPKFLLQFLDRVGQARLRHKDPFGRAADRTCGNDFDYIFELLQRHGCLPFHAARLHQRGLWSL